MIFWTNNCWNSDKRCYYDVDTNLVLKGVNKWFKENFVEDVDFEEIAKKVANKRGISVKEVKDEWSEKNKRGTALHDYINSVLNGDYYKDNDYIKKYKKVIKERIDKFKREGWMPFSIEKNISAFGLVGKPDAILYRKRKDGKLEYLIVDWKFVDKFTTYNVFSNLQNELNLIDSSHLNKYLCVGNIYKHMFYKIMSESDIVKNIDYDKIKILIVNFEKEYKYTDYHENSFFNVAINVNSFSGTISDIIKNKLNKYNLSEERVKLEDYKK